MFAEREIEEFRGPVDTASQTYGTVDKPRICERFYYEFYSEDKRQLLTPDYLDLEVDYNSDEKDDITMTLHSVSGEQNYIVVSVNVVLEISLFEYPMATPVDLPLFLQFR